MGIYFIIIILVNFDRQRAKQGEFHAQPPSHCHKTHQEVRPYQVARQEQAASLQDDHFIFQNRQHADLPQRLLSGRTGVQTGISLLRRPSHEDSIAAQSHHLPRIHDSNR